MAVFVTSWRFEDSAAVIANIFLSFADSSVLLKEAARHPNVASTDTGVACVFCKLLGITPCLLNRV